MLERNAFPLPRALHPTLFYVAHTSFGTAADYAEISYRKINTLRGHLRQLKALNYVASKSFGTPDLESTARWWSLPRGFRALEENAANERDRAWPGSYMAGLGVMARRPDVAAVIARLVAQLAPHVPAPKQYTNLNYVKSGPIDAVAAFPGGRYVLIFYVGLGLPRTSVWDRLKKLQELPVARRYLCLILAPTIHDRNIILSQLRHRQLEGLNCVVSTTHISVTTTGGWLDPRQHGWITNKDLCQSRLSAFIFPDEDRRVSLRDLNLEFLRPRKTSVRGIAADVDLRLPPNAKKLLILLWNSPVFNRQDVMNVLGIHSEPQFSGLLRRLRELDLIVTEHIDGDAYYCLSDQGISHRATQDRCDVTAMRDRLSPTRRWPVPPGASLEADIKSRRGRVLRRAMRNIQHNSGVTKVVGQLCTEMGGHPRWQIGDILWPTRTRMSFTPGSRLIDLGWDLLDWRVHNTHRPDLKAKDQLIQFVPDAMVFLHSDNRSICALIEVELNASTPREWQDRLETYALYSHMRSSDYLPLFIVPSAGDEANVLLAQTQWVEANRARRYPVAVSNFDQIKGHGVTGPIWKVSSSTTDRHTLFELMQVMPTSST